MSLKEYIACLFVCLFVFVTADSEYAENYAWSLWLLLITESFSLYASGETTSNLFHGLKTIFFEKMRWRNYFQTLSKNQS